MGIERDIALEGSRRTMVVSEFSNLSMPLPEGDLVAGLPES